MKVGAMSYAQLILAMLDGCLNCQELAEATGLHYVTVLEYTRALHKAGVAHIAAWEPDVLGRHTIKVYKLGKGKDAKRPKLKASEKQAAYKKRQKALNHQLAVQTALTIYPRNDSSMETP